jgi:hypothetical protein
MAMDDNPFIGMALADIMELQQLYTQVLKDIALAGQSYSFPGRSFTRADIPNVRSILVDLRIAWQDAQGDVNGGGRHQFANAIINTQGRFAP